MIEEHLIRRLDHVHDLHELGEHLEIFLNSGCYIWVEPDGERVLLFGRALVEKIRGLKIHIYADEHPPPHFHVLSADIDAAFTIEDCKLLRGEIDRKMRDLIEYWHRTARRKLIEFWNKTRPTDCPVGVIDVEGQQGD